MQSPGEGVSVCLSLVPCQGRNADLSVDPDFRDLDDHVAVELDLCAELLEQGRPDAYEPFFRDTIQAWVPLFAEQLMNCAEHSWYKDMAALCLACIRDGRDLEPLARGLDQTGFPFAASLLRPGATPMRA